MTTLIKPNLEQELIPLSELEVQSTAMILVADLEDDERAVLASMGLREDDIFRLCRQGSPCIIQVEATRLGLSQEVASRIMVRRCDECNPL